MSVWLTNAWCRVALQRVATLLNGIGSLAATVSHIHSTGGLMRMEANLLGHDVSLGLDVPEGDADPLPDPVGPASSWPGTEDGGAAVTVVVLMANGSGLRAMEFAIGVIVLLISPCYLAEMALAPLDWGGIATRLVMSLIRDGMALRTTVGIIGAAVTPHALCLCASRSLTAGYLELAAPGRHRSAALRGGAGGGLDPAINSQ